MKRNTKQLIPMILVFTIIAAAYSCRILAMLDIGGAWVNYIRAALYLLLFSLWGYSLDRRIIQKQTLHCLRLTAALMLVWLILRTLKYEFVTDLTVARYIWYLYYLPMLFIPLLGVYIALSLGKSEEYRLTERAGFLVAVPGILFLLVICTSRCLHSTAVCRACRTIMAIPTAFFTSSKGGQGKRSCTQPSSPCCRRKAASPAAAKKGSGRL